MMGRGRLGNAVAQHCLLSRLVLIEVIKKYLQDGVRLNCVVCVDSQGPGTALMLAVLC